MKPLTALDEMLGLTASRNLIDASEYSDWLLDLRNRITNYSMHVDYTEATDLIDEALVVANERSLIEAVEVMDLALDLRGPVASFQEKAHNANYADSLVIGGISS